MRAAFIDQALRNFGCNRGHVVLGVGADGRLAAAGVLVPIGGGRWSTYQPSQLPLGTWIMSHETDWCAALRALLRVLPGFPTSIGVTQQDPRSVLRPANDPYIEALDYVATGWVDVTGTYEEFWQARGKNLRQNLGKVRRRIEEQGARLVFEFVERPEAVDAAFLEFATLESAGWKASAGTAISPDNDQGRFYRAMLRDYSTRGAGFAVRLLLDGRPIAVDFGVRDETTLVLLKTTYDEGLKNLSPAQLLHEQFFEFVFERRLARRVEFYGKMMEWHTRWTEQSRTLFHLNYFRSPLLRTARNLLKRVRGEGQADQPRATED